LYPFIRITPEYTIPTYLLILSLTYSLSVVWIYAQAGRKGFDRTLAMDFSLMIMLGGFIGARLTHILYENPNYYLDNPMDVFKIWQGGFVFFGGFVGAFVATYAYAQIKKQKYSEWADFFAPVFPIGYALGRLGCFLNGCCYGAICALPWAVEFNQPGLPTGERHPTQIYAAGWELLVSLPVVLLTQKLISKNKANQKKYAGLAYVSWIIAHCLGRILMEYFRDDYRGDLILGLSISTWVSLVLLLTASSFAYRICRKG
jgi:phosphatidylglycerol:prolipoprotein diacylglycerol transferase